MPPTAVLVGALTRERRRPFICDRRANARVVTLNYHPPIVMYRRFARRLVITRSWRRLDDNFPDIPLHHE